MQQVSIQKASANTLASYLTVQLASQGLADIAVSSKWPSAGKKLPPRAITVLLSGEMQKDLCNNVVVSSVALSGSTTKKTYTIALFQCIQPMQLDVWSTSDIVRDDMIARCDDLLNQGSAQLPGAFNQDPFGEGVLLQLGASQSSGSQQTQWQGTVQFWFENFVEVDEPDTTQRAEYRSTARGEARFCMTTDRTIDRLLGPTLKMRVHEIGAAGSPPAGMLADIYTITGIGKGFVYSTGP